MAGEGIELSIAKYDSINTTYQILPHRRDPKVLSEVGGVGGGSFFVSRNDPKIQDSSVLKSRNICRMKVDGQVVDAFLIQERDPILVSSGENKDRGYLVSGQGLKGWFNDASVAPYGGIKQNSMDQRYFNFASEHGSWYVSGDWINPTVYGSVNVDPRWGDRVNKWPEKAKDAKWIWVAPYVTQAPADPCYFRWTVTTTDGIFAIYVTADDYFELYVDGQQLAKSNTNTSASYEAARIEVPLSAGTHTIGFMARNIVATGFNGPAALGAAIFSVADDKTETLLGTSGSGTWKCLPYPAAEPGWTAGEVMIKLLDEAQARGVLFPTYLTKTFTATQDSKGAAWADKIAWTFKVGESYASVLSKFEDLLEVWIDPANMTLNMAPSRGTNRAIGASPVQFVLGRDLVEAKTKARGDIKNSLMVKSLDGWTIESDSASIATFGTIEDSIDTGTSKSMAKKLAALVFSSRAQEEIGATYQIISTKYKANVHYFVGDWVLAPNERGLMVPRRIVSISYEESSAGRPIPTVEFDIIFQDNESKLATAVGKLGGGGVGGALGNVSGSTPGVGQPTQLPPSASPPTLVPKTPTGLSASSEGYWSANGVNTLSEVTLNWSAVTQYTDDSVLVPDHYVVERKLSSNADGWEIIGKYYTNAAVIPGFTPGQAWDFRVSTVDVLDSVSTPSTPVNHTPVGPTTPMLPPTTPTLTSGMGVIIATWDGKLTPGPVNPPAQFRYVYAEISTAASNQPWTQVGGSIQRGGGQIQISNQPIGSTRWVRFTAIDGMGIASPVSGIASITVSGVDMGALDPAISDAIHNAQTTADGKNSIFRGVNPPVVNPDVPFAQGDLWFELDTDGAIIALKVWDGDSWEPYLLVANTVVALDSITAPLIRAGTITVNELSPSVGDELQLSANGAITTIINSQATQASQLASTQDTANDAAQAAAAAAAAAGTAQGAVDTLDGRVTTVSNAQGATQAQVNNLQTWFRVDANGAHVGQTGSVFQTHIRPNQFDITENDVVTTYWQAGQMVVPSLVADKMKLTNFQFEAYASGMVIRLI